MSGGSSLRARRMRARYFVARDHPAPERVRARLDDGARASLAVAAGPLASLPAGDGSLWFIRRLEIELPVDAAWDRERIAAAWARHIAGAVRAVLARGPDGEGVVRFADRAEYLARFLVALAQGTAWTCWHFARFAGLRPLPASGAIRSVIVSEPADALTALLRLTAPELRLVVETLTPADALRAARALGDRAGDEAVPGDAIRVVELVTIARVGVEERALLLACVECARAGRAPGAAQAELVRAVLRLRALIAAMPAAGAARLLEGLTASSVATIVSVASVADAEVLAPLRGMSREALAPLADGPREQGAETAAGPRATRFGGIFLLLRELVALPLVDALAGWPHCGGAPAPRVARFLVALAAASGDVRRDWFDPVARDLFAIPPALAVAEVARWAGAITDGEWDSLAAALGERPADADAELLALPASLVGTGAASTAIAALGHAVIRRFAARLPGFGRASVAHLFANFLDVRATLEEEAARRVARVGNPPLGLLLRMTGVARGEIVLPWLDARPLVLFPEDV